MKNRVLKLVLSVSLCIVSLQSQDLSKLIIPTKHNKNLTLTQLANIQPGLGTLMIEFGHRFYIAYYAAKAKNWELAEYEIHELVEASEVAEVTRPKYTKQLKAFEDEFIKPLEKAIKAKDWKSFSSQYDKTTTACNACHTATGHSFIKYKLPKNPPLIPSMEL